MQRGKTVIRQSLKGANDEIHSEYSHNHPHTAVQISHIQTHNFFILEILNGDICPVMYYSVSFPPESLCVTSRTFTLCTNLTPEVN